jgi:putative ABC transport system substrate-binding protein
MRRREFITLLGGAAAGWPLAARAQQPGKVWRIGVLEQESITLSPNFDAFRQGLRDLGYVEGRNLIIEYRSADGRAERFPELATDLLRVNVDVLVTRGTPAVLAAKKATTTTPIVMTVNGDPFMVAASLAHPGGNVTGLSNYYSDLEAKGTEVLGELVPGAGLIAGLYNMGNPVVPPEWNQVQAAARKLGIETKLLDIRKSEDITLAFDTASANHAGAIMVVSDALTQDNRALVVKLAAGHRLPAMYGERAFVEAGGLIAYGPNIPDMYRRAACYVDKIFHGASPSDLPIEQPTKFELIVNLKTAKALGLTIPETFLARADEVIE